MRLAQALKTGEHPAPPTGFAPVDRENDLTLRNVTAASNCPMPEPGARHRRSASNTWQYDDTPFMLSDAMDEETPGP